MNEQLKKKFDLVSQSFLKKESAVSVNPKSFQKTSIYWKTFQDKELRFVNFSDLRRELKILWGGQLHCKLELKSDFPLLYRQKIVLESLCLKFQSLEKTLWPEPSLRVSTVFRQHQLIVQFRWKSQNHSDWGELQKKILLNNAINNLPDFHCHFTLKENHFSIELTINNFINDYTEYTSTPNQKHMRAPDEIS